MNCLTPGCEEDIPKTSKHEHCIKCRSSFRYWSPKNKTPAKVMYRRKKLNLFTSRMDLVIKERGLKE